MKCAISPDQIKKLRAGLAKLMKEKYESNDMFFTIESLVRNVYERVLKSTGDQDTALDYARLVPKAVVQVATVKTEYMNKFTENVESFQEGLQLIDGAETLKKICKTVTSQFDKEFIRAQKNSKKSSGKKN